MCGVQELFRNHFCQLQICFFLCLFTVYLILVISNLRDFLPDKISCLGKASLYRSQLRFVVFPVCGVKRGIDLKRFCSSFD
jgi:hypothetical protein